MDEDDLKGVANEGNEEKDVIINKRVQMKMFDLQLLGFWKCSQSSEMQIDALMHRHGLTDECVFH